ncbi:sugar kinase [Chryseolinea lacunae]|uniref:Sugar kinase n=1 Tax=Chryseolinea lacunae TaxID=2801331 RepID=A0ABS1L280_9BACT|nr:sugar kinase [Chryseolinea lacunae]MBL0745759.1 sugar kinase [Chryseolinea lacunae]
MSQIVTFGEILLRFSTSDQNRFSQSSQLAITFGGSEANVAGALASWGSPCMHITALPENAIGKCAAEAFNKLGVNVQALPGSGRMGTYYIEGGVSLRSPQIIYDRYHSVFSEATFKGLEWKNILAKAKWFHWSGITPAISASAAEACLTAVQTAKSMGVSVSGDINYRRNLWKYGKAPIDIMPELIAHSDLIIAGTEDFKNSAGIPSNSFEDMCNLAINRFPNIKQIATTHRHTKNASNESISATLWSKGNVSESETFHIAPVVDRIGAGDAFMAGILYGILNGYTDVETINFAAASCALKHTIKGDVNLLSVQEVTALVNNERVGQLRR